MLYHSFLLVSIMACLGELIRIIEATHDGLMERNKPISSATYHSWLAILLGLSYFALFYALLTLTSSGSFLLRTLALLLGIVPSVACCLFGLAAFFFVRQFLLQKIRKIISFYIAEFVYLIYLLTLLWLWGALFGGWANVVLAPLVLSLNEIGQKFFLAFTCATWLASACLIYWLVRISFSGRIRDLLKMVH